MDLEPHEQAFLELLTSVEVTEEHLSRTEDGCLVVTLSSPCPEIGALRVYVWENEVALSCKVSHSHVTEVESPTGELLKGAAEKVDAFLSDRVAVCREFAPNGDQISSGWSPVDAIGSRNAEYEALIAKQYGGPSQTVYWFWSGRRVAL